MKCDKCKGRGWYENPKYPEKGNFAGIPSIDCGKCKGSGYVIGNIKDVLQHLKYLQIKFEYDKTLLREINQCIDTIENN